MGRAEVLVAHDPHGPSRHVGCGRGQNALSAGNRAGATNRGAGCKRGLVDAPPNTTPYPPIPALSRSETSTGKGGARTQLAAGSGSGESLVCDIGVDNTSCTK